MSNHNNINDEKTFDGLWANFVMKMTHLILNQRIIWPIQMNHSTTTTLNNSTNNNNNNIKNHNHNNNSNSNNSNNNNGTWFNFQVDTVEEVTNKLSQTLKAQASKANSLYVYIDVYVESSNHQQHHSSNNKKINVLLERWILSCSNTATAAAATATATTSNNNNNNSNTTTTSSTIELHNAYRKVMVLMRSVYSYLLLLPSYKLYLKNLKNRRNGSRVHYNIMASQSMDQSRVFEENASTLFKFSAIDIPSMNSTIKTSVMYRKKTPQLEELLFSVTSDNLMTESKLIMDHFGSSSSTVHNNNNHTNNNHKRVNSTVDGRATSVTATVNTMNNVNAGMRARSDSSPMIVMKKQSGGLSKAFLEQRQQQQQEHPSNNDATDDVNTSTNNNNTNTSNGSGSGNVGNQTTFTSSSKPPVYKGPSTSVPTTTTSSLSTIHHMHHQQQQPQQQYYSPQQQPNGNNSSSSSGIPIKMRRTDSQQQIAAFDETPPFSRQSYGSYGSSHGSSSRLSQQHLQQQMMMQQQQQQAQQQQQQYPPNSLPINSSRARANSVSSVGSTGSTGSLGGASPPFGNYLIGASASSYRNSSAQRASRDSSAFKLSFSPLADCALNHYQPSTSALSASLKQFTANPHGINAQTPYGSSPSNSSGTLLGTSLENRLMMNCMVPTIFTRHPNGGTDQSLMNNKNDASTAIATSDSVNRDNNKNGQQVGSHSSLDQTSDNDLFLNSFLDFTPHFLERDTDSSHDRDTDSKDDLLSQDDDLLINDLHYGSAGVHSGPFSHLHSSGLAFVEDNEKTSSQQQANQQQRDHVVDTSPDDDEDDVDCLLHMIDKAPTRLRSFSRSELMNNRDLNRNVQDIMEHIQKLKNLRQQSQQV